MILDPMPGRKAQSKRRARFIEPIAQAVIRRQRSESAGPLLLAAMEFYVRNSTRCNVTTRQMAYWPDQEPSSRTPATADVSHAVARQPRARIDDFGFWTWIILLLGEAYIAVRLYISAVLLPGEAWTPHEQLLSTFIVFFLAGAIPVAWMALLRFVYSRTLWPLVAWTVLIPAMLLVDFLSGPLCC
jgi:hypothetical protein